MSIEQIKKEIEEEISKFDGDIERITFYLITLGQRNVGMGDRDKNDQNVVKGCQAKIWLKAFIQNDKVLLSIDSNTIIIKGMGSILVRLFNGQKPEDILYADMQSSQLDDFNRFVGDHRSNGLKYMINYLKQIVVGLLIVEEIDRSKIINDN
jgi:cysteine desulfuration protein SufE